jgi:DNA-binding MarR family transcriptional regulator
LYPAGDVLISKRFKYVNMADINFKNVPDDDRRLAELVELLFFAYRDFVSDPDAILERIGFGRAHHRVIHFVGRSPGMPVAELLAILKITKQSLGRVLRELIERGYVRQEEGSLDRRQRLLYLTASGEELKLQLIAPQIDRFRRALGGPGKASESQFRAVILGMIDAEGREQIRSLSGDAQNRKPA